MASSSSSSCDGGSTAWGISMSLWLMLPWWHGLYSGSIVVLVMTSCCRQGGGPGGAVVGMTRILLLLPSLLSCCGGGMNWGRLLSCDGSTTTSLSEPLSSHCSGGMAQGTLLSCSSCCPILVTWSGRKA